MSNTPDNTLRGRILIASPAIGDPRFERTIIYMCAHSVDKGAMGLILNKPVEGVDFRTVFKQLNISDIVIDDLRVHSGGPVETTRGFVLHSADYESPDGSIIADDVTLTATLDILKDIAVGAGPRKRILALGYAGWAAGQIEEEIRANGWLVADADEDLVFDGDLEAKWDKALAKLGVDASNLHGQGGTA